MALLTALFIAGSILIALGQTWLSLQLHPSELCRASDLLQGLGAVIVGTTIAVSALLGMSDGHDRDVLKLTDLLGTKQLPAVEDCKVRSRKDLRSCSLHFWQSYIKLGLALCLFMSGLLAVSLWLRDLSLSRYVLSIGLALALCTILNIALSTRALIRLRRTRMELRGTMAVLDLQPEIAAEIADIPPSHGQIRWKRNPIYSRSVTRARSSAKMIRKPVV